MDEIDIDRAIERDRAAVEKSVNSIIRLVSAAGDSGAKDCIDCGDEIPPARRKAAPWSDRCVHCQEGRER